MLRFLALLTLAGLPLAACAKSPSTSDGVAITATDTTCAVAQTTFSPGDVTFAVTNKGSKVTEVYVYAGARIVTEVENIGPGTSRTMTATLAPGEYQIACKPGQTGDGIRTAITVTGSPTSPSPSPSPSPAEASRSVVATVTATGLTLTGSGFEAGSRITVQLANNAPVKRELEVIDPNNKEVTAVEAGPHGAATVDVTLTLRGTWTLKVEDTEFVQTFTVA